jgi:4-alpha-glucanotransferase
LQLYFYEKALYKVMTYPRASGILLHPTSLPGRFGIGDLGDEAFQFVDFLVQSGQTYWQVLPLGPTGYGDSPYQCFSAFAGNTMLISPQRLYDEGFLSKEEIEDVPEFPKGRVDFGKAIEWKTAILQKAFGRFRETKKEDILTGFEAFCHNAQSWLDDYALFRAIKATQGGVSWHKWDARLARREPAALANAYDSLKDEVHAQKFFQFLFFEQWVALKKHCKENGVKIVGDIPIFVSHDSSDVWCNPSYFKLNEDGSPKFVAGVPPDYFSKTGQLWGNPVYDWSRLQADGFRWWIDRMRALLRIVDFVRLDHFRGFAAYWEIPGGDKTAERGEWTPAMGRELFVAMKNALGRLPIIAEDLGVITPDVESLRDDFGFPGMRILQFAFGGDTKCQDLPHNYHKNVAVYTGTHDNDTTVGWFNSQAGAGSTRDERQIQRERKFCLDYLNSDGKEIHWDFIRAVQASVADTAIVPMQDLLGLGTEARMNLPATTSGNWQWRFKDGAVTEEIGARLKELTLVYGRNVAMELKEREEAARREEEERKERKVLESEKA